VLRKIYRKIFPVNKKSKIEYNLIGGENNIIDPSAIISTTQEGKIILQGCNYIGRNVEMGTSGTIEIGVNTSIQDRCIILGDVEIGKYCTFAPNVYISSGRHYYNYKPYYYIKNQDELIANDKILSEAHSKKVTIGDDCWLGINVVIMSGLTIGRGCVIGANSVVTKNLEPFSVVGGSPAKFIKHRLDFIPKHALSFDNENDLPNFYKGFFIDYKSLKENYPHKGIIASNKFTVYLTSQGKKIHITLKKINSNSLTINYNNQNFTLTTNEFTTLTFELLKVNYHEFIVTELSGKNERCLLVNKIEITD
jgi:acetyltransferase-like isoleucine patch superfamily enzyme